MTVIADFASFMARGYRSPRAAVRDLLNAGHGFNVALLFIALGYLIETILVELLIGRSLSSEVPLISFHLSSIVMTLFGFLILSGLVFWVGRAMGGKATLAQSQLAISWFMLISSVLTPFALMAMPEQLRNPPTDPDVPIDMSDANLTIMMIVSAIAFWLLSSTIAEAHGFRSVWRVAAVILAIPMSAATLLTILAG